MTFHDPEKNDNVETNVTQPNMRASFFPSYSSKGASQRNMPLRKNAPKDQLIQTNTTFLHKRGSEPPRPRSRESRQGNTVMDFDWYGNSN